MSNIRLINDEVLKQIAYTIKLVGYAFDEDNDEIIETPSGSVYPITNKVVPLNFKFGDAANYIKLIDNGIMFNTEYGGVLVNGGLNLVNMYVSNTGIFHSVIGYGVTNCWRTFYNCRNLIGDPIIKSKIIDSLGETYGDCWSLTGGPQCGPNVKNLTKAYYNDSNISHSIVNVENFKKVELASQAFYNCCNMPGAIPPLPNATTLYQTFYNCTNIIGNFDIDESVTNATEAFYGCSNIESICIHGVKRDHSSLDYDIFGGSSEPVIGPQLANIQNAFRDCHNLKNLTYYPYEGQIEYPSNITNMDNAFCNCYNLKTEPYVSPKITTVGCQYAFTNCYNIYGAPMFSPLATSGYFMYAGCNNITGMPDANQYVNLVNATEMFDGCSNMHGTLFFTAKTTQFANAFNGCSNLGGIFIGATNVNATKAAQLAGAFNRPAGSARLNVIFQTLGIYNVGITAAAAGCTMSASTTITENVDLPYCYSNGKVYGYENRAVKRYAFNEEHNLYIYCVN